MKLSNKAALILGLLSSAVIANEHNLPINNVEVKNTELSTLSIQNLSSEVIEIDLYGESFSLNQASGIQFECAGYNALELKIKNNVHDYFEIPCNSRVVFTESFTNQFKQGE